MAFERHDRRWYAPRVPSGRPVATVQRGLGGHHKPAWRAKEAREEIISK